MKDEAEDLDQIVASLLASEGNIGKVPLNEITIGVLLFSFDIARSKTAHSRAQLADARRTAVRLVGVPGLTEKRPQLRDASQLRLLLHKLEQKAMKLEWQRSERRAGRSGRARGGRAVAGGGWRRWRGASGWRRRR